MKIDWKAVLFFAILVLGFGFFIGKSCNENASISELNRKIDESNKRIEESKLAEKKWDDSLLVLFKQRAEIKNYYNYEITKIDSIFALPDTTWANAVLRLWANRFNGLPEFFQRPSDDSGTSKHSEDPTAW